MPSKYLVQQIIKEYLEDGPDINGVLDLIRDLDSYVTKLQQRIKQCQVLIPSGWPTEKHNQEFEEVYIWLCKLGYTIGSPHLWAGYTGVQPLKDSFYEGCPAPLYAAKQSPIKVNPIKLTFIFIGFKI